MVHATKHAEMHPEETGQGAVTQHSLMELGFTVYLLCRARPHGSPHLMLKFFGIEYDGGISDFHMLR